MKIANSQKSGLNDNDIKSLLTVVFKDQGYSGLRDYVMLLLLLSLGLRVAQIVNIKISDVNLHMQEISLSAETTKSGHDVVQYFSLPLKTWIEQLIKQNAILGYGSDCLFNNTDGTPYSADAFRKALRRYKEKAGITTRVTPHDFRHFFANKYIEHGGDIFTLKEIFQHKDIRTTLRYVPKQGDDQDRE